MLRSDAGGLLREVAFVHGDGWVTYSVPGRPRGGGCPTLTWSEQCAAEVAAGGSYERKANT